MMDKRSLCCTKSMAHAIPPLTFNYVSRSAGQISITIQLSISPMENDSSVRGNKPAVALSLSLFSPFHTGVRCWWYHSPSYCPSLVISLPTSPSFICLLLLNTTILLLYIHFQSLPKCCANTFLRGPQSLATKVFQIHSSSPCAQRN